MYRKGRGGAISLFSRDHLCCGRLVDRHLDRKWLQVFTCARGQQAQLPSVFLQQVFISGQRWVASHTTSPWRGPCQENMGTFLNCGTDSVVLSQVWAGRLQLVPCGQQCM